MIPAIAAGEEGAPILLAAGPPLSARAFAQVQSRLLPRRTLALELAEAPGEGLQALTDALSDAIRETDARALVACGLAVPPALRAGAQALVVCNGPVAELDPFTAALARLPAPIVAGVALRGRLVRRWLASSLGLRRLVVNPYVMDHDTVAALLAPLIRDAAARRRTAAWIAAMPQAVSAPDFRGGELSAVWGEDDRIYPVSQAKEALEALGVARVVEVPGGRHLMLEERPWELADALVEILE